MRLIVYGSTPLSEGLYILQNVNPELKDKSWDVIIHVVSYTSQ